MSGNPKFAILEKDGEEFAGAAEYIPEAEDILFEKGGDATVKDKLAFPANALLPRTLHENLTIPEDNALILMDVDIDNYCLEVDGCLGVL